MILGTKIIHFGYRFGVQNRRKIGPNQQHKCKPFQALIDGLFLVDFVVENEGSTTPVYNIFEWHVERICAP